MPDTADPQSREHTRSLNNGAIMGCGQGTVRPREGRILPLHGAQISCALVWSIILYYYSCGFLFYYGFILIVFILSWSINALLLLLFRLALDRPAVMDRPTTVEEYTPSVSCSSGQWRLLILSLCHV